MVRLCDGSSSSQNLSKTTQDKRNQTTLNTCNIICVTKSFCTLNTFDVLSMSWSRTSWEDQTKHKNKHLPAVMDYMRWSLPYEKRFKVSLRSTLQTLSSKVCMITKMFETNKGWYAASRSLSQNKPWQDDYTLMQTAHYNTTTVQIHQNMDMKRCFKPPLFCYVKRKRLATKKWSKKQPGGKKQAV